eukprot:262137-Amphidinium_carterae.1
MTASQAVEAAKVTRIQPQVRRERTRFGGWLWVLGCGRSFSLSVFNLMGGSGVCDTLEVEGDNRRKYNLSCSLKKAPGSACRLQHGTA